MRCQVRMVVGGPSRGRRLSRSILLAARERATPLLPAPRQSTAVGYATHQAAGNDCHCEAQPWQSPVPRPCNASCGRLPIPIAHCCIQPHRRPESSAYSKRRWLGAGRPCQHGSGEPRVGLPSVPPVSPRPPRHALTDVASAVPPPDGGSVRRASRPRPAGPARVAVPSSPDGPGHGALVVVARRPRRGGIAFATSVRAWRPERPGRSSGAGCLVDPGGGWVRAAAPAVGTGVGPAARPGQSVAALPWPSPVPRPDTRCRSRLLNPTTDCVMTTFRQAAQRPGFVARTEADASAPSARRCWSSCSVLTHSTTASPPSSGVKARVISRLTSSKPLAASFAR